MRWHRNRTSSLQNVLQTLSRGLRFSLSKPSLSAGRDAILRAELPKLEFHGYIGTVSHGEISGKTALTNDTSNMTGLQVAKLLVALWKSDVTISSIACTGPFFLKAEIKWTGVTVLSPKLSFPFKEISDKSFHFALPHA